MGDFFRMKVALIKDDQTVQIVNVSLLKEFDSYDEERDFLYYDLYYEVGDALEERKNDEEYETKEFDSYKILDVDGEHDEDYYRRPTLYDYGMSERDFL